MPPFFFFFDDGDHTWWLMFYAHLLWTRKCSKHFTCTISPTSHRLRNGCYYPYVLQTRHRNNTLIRVTEKEQSREPDQSLCDAGSQVLNQRSAHYGPGPNAGHRLICKVSWDHSHPIHFSIAYVVCYNGRVSWADDMAHRAGNIYCLALQKTFTSLCL